MGERGMAERIWKKFENDSMFALYSPFFVCLAAEKLDSQSFHHCISQKVHFLTAFAEAYQIEEDWVDSIIEKKAIRNLKESVLNKLHTYDNIVKEWGFELQNDDVSEETTKYRDFLLGIASGKIKSDQEVPFKNKKLVAYTLSAIVPCMRLYVYVCERIPLHLNPNTLDYLLDDQRNQIYKKWIEHYSSQDFKVSIKQIEDKLDKLSVFFIKKDVEEVEKLYDQAMKLQIQFFAAQLPISQQTVVPLSSHAKVTIFCNFDLTCTVLDTSNVLAELLSPQHVPKERRWRTEFQVFVGALLPHLPAKEYDYEGLIQVLEKVVKFSKLELEELEESRELKGAIIWDIYCAGNNLVYQDGCRRFFRKLKKNPENIDLHIVSSCLCGDLIRSSLFQDLNESNIHSNELIYDQNSVTTGEITKKVNSLAEKFQIVNDVVIRQKNEERRRLTIYVGRSLGDLLCLVEADIGIVFGEGDPELTRVARYFGITLIPLFYGVVQNQTKLAESSPFTGTPRSGILYTVSSWVEIQACIMGS